MVTHRALRADLARLAARLGQVAGGNPEPAAVAAPCRYAATLLTQVAAQHRHEDQIVWPLIAATAGECVDLAPLTDDHHAIEAELIRASRALAAFRTGADPHAATARRLEPVLTRPEIRRDTVRMLRAAAGDKRLLVGAAPGCCPAAAWSKSTTATRWCRSTSPRRSPA